MISDALQDSQQTYLLFSVVYCGWQITDPRSELCVSLPFPCLVGVVLSLFISVSRPASAHSQASTCYMPDSEEGGDREWKGGYGGHTLTHTNA